MNRPKGINALGARLLCFIVAVVAGSLEVFAGQDEERWWPVQAVPKTVIRASTQPDAPEQRAGVDMLLQSAAGLAAKAVNERRGKEMVWIEAGGDLERWLARFMAVHPSVIESEPLKPWELVDHLIKSGVIKGYILYRSDTSKGEHNTHRPEMDCSINVATSLAGLLNGIVIEEGLEKAAKDHGLTLLMDARGKSQKWCFETYQAQFNRRIICTQDPRKPHVRDLAIAQKAFTMYGSDEPLKSALEWLEPLSPVLGWNGGDEFQTTDLSTGYGHIQTATDWCFNLPVLMAGSDKLELPRLPDLDPKTIDWNDSRSAVSFIGSDGDNVQWMQGNFFAHPSYWANPERGKIPFGWSSCFDHLAQVCPQALEYALTTRLPNDSFIEWGGGYYYPDHFGRLRKNGWELLSSQARCTWELMKKTNTRIIGFNVAQFDSAEALKACQVFAREMDGLLAILVFQYAPYEAGAGQTFWVKDRHGVEVPVISARYSIWEHSNDRPHAGTPARIAHDIRRTIAESPRSELPRYDWAIAHAWSYFKRAPGNDEEAENMPQETAAEKGGVRGYAPVVWCAERLPAAIRVVSPEELAWRIRMKHDPIQTKELINRFSTAR